MKTCTLALLCVVAASVPFTPRPAPAALGETVRSLDADQKSLAAAKRVVKSHDGYTVHELISPSATVREYATSSGVVFALAWNGIAHPDLTPLLGAYSGEYRAALKKTAHSPGRRALQVKAERVVVEKWGHMRNLQGRAYAPALVPPGVQLHEIR